MDNCKVSVIIPLYNGSKYITQTLDSVLAQTYSDYEIVIVDDASMDNSYEVVEQYIAEHRDVVFRLDKSPENRGIAATRNRAIELSCGEYIALLDQDDIALPKRLELSADFLDKNPEFGAVGGGVRFIDEYGKERLDRTMMLWRNPLYIKASLLFRNMFINCEMMFRKEIVEKYNIKYYDNFYGVEDFAFWAEYSRYAKFGMLQELFLLHRLHDSNGSELYSGAYAKEREECYAFIQRKSIMDRGICLNDWEYEIIHQEFCEYGKKMISVAELKELRKVLISIVCQAEKMELEEAKEIEIVCKQLFHSCNASNHRYKSYG